MFQLIDVEESNFAEVGFSHIIHHRKSVIPTGGTALFAVPERRNPSLTSEFKIRPSSFVMLLDLDTPALCTTAVNSGILFGEQCPISPKTAPWTISVLTLPRFSALPGLSLPST
ncbi:MAG: hypothetical protein WCE53_13765 [Candidatus Acidiferrum sp.]